MTVNEMEFQQEHGQTLTSAHHLLLRYRHSNVKADILQAWELYYRVFRSINKKLTQLTQLELQVQGRGVPLVGFGHCARFSSPSLLEGGPPRLWAVSRGAGYEALVVPYAHCRKGSRTAVLVVLVVVGVGRVVCSPCPRHS